MGIAGPCRASAMVSVIAVVVLATLEKGFDDVQCRHEPKIIAKAPRIV
jgi:hypothetical protein